MANSKLPKLVKKQGYARILLEFLQKNPKLKVAWCDFLKIHFFKRYPFIWQSPTSRLSELKELWLVDIVWRRKNILKNMSNIYLYQINKKWLDYKFII